MSISRSLKVDLIRSGFAVSYDHLAIFLNPMAPAESNTNATLEADYRSLQTTTTFTHTLHAPSTRLSTEEKTTYLSTLRKSVSKLQEEVNAFLTQEMERDKAGTVQAGVKVDDKKEDDNYGEEVLDDET